MLLVVAVLSLVSGLLSPNPCIFGTINSFCTQVNATVPEKGRVILHNGKIPQQREILHRIEVKKDTLKLQRQALLIKRATHPVAGGPWSLVVVTSSIAFFLGCAVSSAISILV